jgi:CBS domain-containing protein
VKIRQILTEKGLGIVSVWPDDNLATAAQSMTNNGVGSALVMNEAGDILGVITERDILRQCRDLTCSFVDTKVSSVMTTDIQIAFPDDDVETMIATMVKARFRHLPVVSDGQLVGMVSMGDLVKSQLKHTKVENRFLKDYIQGKYPV